MHTHRCTPTGFASFRPVAPVSLASGRRETELPPGVVIFHTVPGRSIRDSRSADLPVSDGVEPIDFSLGLSGRTPRRASPLQSKSPICNSPFLAATTTTHRSSTRDAATAASDTLTETALRMQQRSSLPRSPRAAAPVVRRSVVVKAATTAAALAVDLGAVLEAATAAASAARR